MCIRDRLINCVDDDHSVLVAIKNNDVFVSKIAERCCLHDACADHAFINLRKRKYHNMIQKHLKLQRKWQYISANFTNLGYIFMDSV